MFNYTHEWFLQICQTLIKELRFVTKLPWLENKEGLLAFLIQAVTFIPHMGRAPTPTKLSLSTEAMNLNFIIVTNGSPQKLNLSISLPFQP